MFIGSSLLRGVFLQAISLVEEQGKVTAIERWTIVDITATIRTGRGAESGRKPRSFEIIHRLDLLTVRVYQEPTISPSFSFYFQHPNMKPPAYAASAIYAAEISELPLNTLFISREGFLPIIRLLPYL